MLRLLALLTILLVPIKTMALDCDCEVMVFAPISATWQNHPNQLKAYPLEGFSSYSVKNQIACRESCLKEFEQDMHRQRLSALLVGYSEELFNNGLLGFNCTGETLIKYPVRVRAVLGNKGLGNVADFVQPVTIDKDCF